MVAYDALSDGMKRMLEGMRAVHSDIYQAGPQAGKNKGSSNQQRDHESWETRTVHPVVRTHPETGRKMRRYRRSPDAWCCDCPGTRFRWQNGSIARFRPGTAAHPDLRRPAVLIPALASRPPWG